LRPLGAELESVSERGACGVRQGTSSDGNRFSGVMQDQRYDYLRIADDDYDDWIARIPLDYLDRGIPLQSFWRSAWNFQTLEDTLEHRCGLGDFAVMNNLIAATHAKAYEVLSFLLGESARVLQGRYDGGPIWPVGLDIRSSRVARFLRCRHALHLLAAADLRVLHALGAWAGLLIYQLRAALLADISITGVSWHNGLLALG
jgi:hypothetical protein